MAKQIVYGDDARKFMKDGVQQASKCFESDLGTQGPLRGA